MDIALFYLWLLVGCDEKAQKITKLVTNILMYISIIVLPISIAAGLLPITFLAFSMIHTICAIFAWKIKNNVLATQFLLFVTVDLYALYINL